MIYNLTGRKSGAIIVIDGKAWRLFLKKDGYGMPGWILLLCNNKKTLYIADLYTRSVVWSNKQILEYVLNRRLYRIIEKYNSGVEIKKVAGLKDVAKK